MSNIRVIEDEYWAVQYKIKYGNEIVFWPEDGHGKYDTESAAHAAAPIIKANYGGSAIRILHVVRRIEYSDPITE